jgi:prepilin-type N-terminal cleavage/methylation domain-containing protein
MNIVKNKKGFTLAEIIVVMAIIAIFGTMMIAVFNSIGITNKARDAQRKEDLKKIKVAFEEYFNDKGYYPPDVDSWNIASNCGKNVFSPYLNSWPCGPGDVTYKILVESSSNKFRAITNLENRKDKDIPSGWYLKNDFNMPALNLTTDTANYGVSSTNILWYDGATRDYSMCYLNTCFDGNSGCKDVSSGIGCIGNCFYQSLNGGGCRGECSVSCCGKGCIN